MKQIAIFILFISLGLSSYAQEEKNQLFLQNIELGTLSGVEISRNTGDFKFAYAFRYTGMYKISQQFSLGAGVGFEKYDNISLLPIFIDAHAFLKPQINTSYFSFQMGYAPGWHKEYQQLDDYNFNGGLFMGFDYGKRIPIKNDLNFNIALGLKFQNSSVEINNVILENYKENINFILLSFKAGIGF